MHKLTAIDKVVEKFTEYLSSQDISKKSLKNYKSDVSHFSAWLIFKIRTFGVYADSLTEAVAFITPNSAHEYRDYLVQNNIPESTINRRLSTLRHLGNFLTASQILDFDFTENISNVRLDVEEKEEHPLLVEFEKHLGEEDVSQNTIRNYKSDVRQFIEWLERKKAQYEAN
jgi:site-specific recombinase XerD